MALASSVTNSVLIKRLYAFGLFPGASVKYLCSATGFRRFGCVMPTYDDTLSDGFMVVQTSNGAHTTEWVHLCPCPEVTDPVSEDQRAIYEKEPQVTVRLDDKTFAALKHWTTRPLLENYWSNERVVYSQCVDGILVNVRVLIEQSQPTRIIVAVNSKEFQGSLTLPLKSGDMQSIILGSFTLDCGVIVHIKCRKEDQL